MARVSAGVAEPGAARDGAAMPSLYFEEALLKSGWATGVRVEIDGGLIAGVETGTQASAGDELHSIGLPGMPNLHSHAFQRARKLLFSVVFNDMK